MPTEVAGVLHRPTPLGEPFRPAFEGPKALAVMREGSTLEELTSAIGVHGVHSDFGPCSHTSFKPLRMPGAGGTRAENKPTHLTGDRKLPSDPYITGALEA
jgi:hypothetical protein